MTSLGASCPRAGVDVVRHRAARAGRHRRRPAARRVAPGLPPVRHGPGAFKVDLAVEGGVPWTAEACRRAGTVHVGGTFDEIAAAEADVHRGRMPERPFVLVAQQYLSDPQRSAGDVHPVWAYAHVPHGYTGDAHRRDHRPDRTLRARLPRPDRRPQHVIDPADFEAYNPNYVGGDIADRRERPVAAAPAAPPRVDPYATGDPGCVPVLGRHPARVPGSTACAATTRPAGRCATSENGRPH